MNARNNPITGARYLWEGMQLITRPRIRRFVVIPLIINTLLFALLIYSLYLATTWLGVELEGWLPDWLDWLKYLLWPLYLITVLVVCGFGFSVVGNLLGAPFNGLLAEAVEQHLTGQPIASESGWFAVAAEIKRTVASELRKLAYIAARAIPLLILLWIPGLNVLASGLWMIFAAWMMAIQYADYPMGNHGLTFPAQRKLLATQRVLSLGFGGAVMMAMLVPILNFVVMPASVAGATAMWLDHFAKDHARLE